jgi:hypothetical protein
LPAKYKKKRNAGKKEENIQTICNKGPAADSRDGQITYLMAENLRFKVAVLADSGSDYSAISRSAVEYARKHGFPLKVEVLPEPILLLLLLYMSFAAKDETSVDIMGRKLCGNFLRKSRL